MDIDAAVREAERELLSKANVNGVGLGDRDGLMVLQVYVTRKQPVSELQPADVIPPTVAGLPTQVVEIGEVSARTDTQE